MHGDSNYAYWFRNAPVKGHVVLDASSGGAPTGHRGPAHCVGRVHVETGKVEYRELPVGVERANGSADRFLFGASLATATTDSRGVEIAAPHTRIEMPAEPAAYAQRFYAAHREADATAATLFLIVVPPERDGPWVALHDRIRRAGA